MSVELTEFPPVSHVKAIFRRYELTNDRQYLLQKERQQQRGERTWNGGSPRRGLLLRLKVNKDKA